MGRLVRHDAAFRLVSVTEMPDREDPDGNAEPGEQRDADADWQPRRGAAWPQRVRRTTAARSFFSVVLAVVQIPGVAPG
ncbi:MAG: hypothetical protein RLZZ458_1107 [Planctomycetota bacterium]|jgi:hypothetical protein